MSLRKGILLSLIFLLAGGVAYSQIVTGSIRGEVTDETGAILPGVLVELSSPALIGGVHTTYTTEKGFYRFPSLPPGLYELTFSLEGFQTLKRQDIKVIVGSAVTEDVVLRLAPLEETITVTGESPLVDITKSGISTNWTTELMENLPLERFTFFDLVNVTPGLWTGSGEASSRSIAFGGMVESNAYQFEGVDVSAPEYGAAWPWINPDIIQEIEVKGIGAKAEDGQFTGTVINVVTKSGGNDFHGAANLFYRHDNLMWDNSADFMAENMAAGRIDEEQAQWPFHVDKWYDVGAQLGGPIMKDKIWFFGAFWRQIDATSENASNPSYVATFRETQAFIKGTAQLTSNNRLSGYYNYEWFALPNAIVPGRTPDSTVTEDGGAPTATLLWTSILSDRTFFDIRFAYTGGYDSEQSMTGNWDATHYDADTDTITSGGPWWPWFYDTSRHQVNASVSHYAEEFLAGDHDFKFGVQFNRGFAETVGGYAAGYLYYHYTYFYYDYAYEYNYVFQQTPFAYGGIVNSVGLFMDDTWTVSDRVTLNVGVRFDHSKGSIHDLPRYNNNWDKTGEMVPGIDNVVTWNSVSPRIGAAITLTEDEKTLLRLNFGRYYDAMVIGNWDYPGTAVTPWIWWNVLPDGSWEKWYEWLPEEVTIDPNHRNPYSDQFSIGIDHELVPNFSLSATAIFKWNRDIIGYVPEGGSWNPYYERTTRTEPYTGEMVEVWNEIQKPPIIISNPDWLWTDYKALIITANKRMSNNWQMVASFTWSKSYGVPASRWMTYQSNLLYGMTFGRSPNDFINHEGPLGGDRPYAFRLQGTYQFPYGIILSGNLQIMSGTPYTRLANIFGLNQGTVSISAEERGAHGHRLPSIKDLDIRVEKRFQLSDNIRLRGFIEIFNILNSDNPYGFWSRTLAPGEDFVPDAIFPPRRMMVGVKMEF